MANTVIYLSSFKKVIPPTPPVKSTTWEELTVPSITYLHTFLRLSQCRTFPLILFWCLWARNWYFSAATFSYWNYTLTQIKVIFLPFTFELKKYYFSKRLVISQLPKLKDNYLYITYSKVVKKYFFSLWHHFLQHRHWASWKVLTKGQ